MFSNCKNMQLMQNYFYQKITFPCHLTLKIKGSHQLSKSKDLFELFLSSVLLRMPPSWMRKPTIQSHYRFIIQIHFRVCMHYLHVLI